MFDISSEINKAAGAQIISFLLLVSHFKVTLLFFSDSGLSHLVAHTQKFLPFLFRKKRLLLALLYSSNVLFTNMNFYFF